MDIKKLEYFLAIAETLNLSKAAEKLHMSQPPLTYQLKALEDELGIRLFQRTTRKLTITKEGELLKERARQILDLIAMTKEELANLDQHQTIRIGFVASSAALLSPEKLTKFHALYKDIKFTMKEGSTYQIIDYLEHGIIDIGLVRTPFNAERFNVEYLESEPMIAVYGKTYSFDQTISLKTLNGIPLVLDKRFSSLITNTCHKEGILPNIICEGEDSRSLLSWTKAGLGVAILPYSGKSFIDSKELMYSTISNKDLATKGAIVTLKQKDDMVYLRDLLQIIKE